MPKRIYVGSHDAVEVLLPDGEIATVAKGESQEFPDDIVKELDVSAAWSKDTPAPTSTQDKVASTSEKE